MFFDGGLPRLTEEPLEEVNFERVQSIRPFKAISKYRGSFSWLIINQSKWLSVDYVINTGRDDSLNSLPRFRAEQRRVRL